MNSNIFNDIYASPVFFSSSFFLYVNTTRINRTFSKKVKSKLFLICLNLDFIQLMMQRDLHPYYDRIKTKAIIHLLIILKLICPFFYINLLHAILLLLIIIYIHQTFQILVNPLYVLHNHFLQNNMLLIKLCMYIQRYVTTVANGRVKPN